MTYKEEKRDLFAIPNDYYFVQCISADFGMGKGIAVQFNKHFDMKNQILKYYPSNIWDGKGYMRCVQGIPVLNLVTKEHYWDKPTYNTITEALQKMKTYIKKCNIQKLAMPKIGCGLDKLEWSKVSDIIKNIFKDTDVEFLVCYI